MKSVDYVFYLHKVSAYEPLFSIPWLQLSGPDVQGSKIVINMSKTKKTLTSVTYLGCVVNNWQILQNHDNLMTKIYIGYF